MSELKKERDLIKTMTESVNIRRNTFALCKIQNLIGQRYFFLWSILKNEERTKD